MSRWLLPVLGFMAASAPVVVAGPVGGVPPDPLLKAPNKKDFSAYGQSVQRSRGLVHFIVENLQSGPDALGVDGGGPTFGLWRIVCPTNESCRLSQSIVAGASRESILVARAYKHPSPVLVLSVPAGIYLAPGLALQVGAGKSRRYPFETCSADGCHTGIRLDKALIGELAAGKDGKVSFFDGTQKVVTVVLGLAGFAKGYAALK